MKQISFFRLLRFSITASIILTLIAFIFNVGIASAEVQYSESFFFSGSNVLSEVPVAGVGVAASTNITGAIDKLQVDFDDGKVIDQIQAGNGSFALTTGGRVIPKLSASLNGVNLNLTNFDAYVANTLYGYGVIGWQRLDNNNYTYIIDFDYVDEAYAATLTGQTTIGLIYDDVVFTGITASSASSGAVTNTYNYAAIEGSINSGGFGQRSATYVAEPTYIYFEFTDTATVTANNISSSYAYINLTKSGVNYGFNITNASGGEFYGVTSVNDVSQLLNFTQGISFNLHHIGLDSWANRTIYDATGNLSVGPIPPTPGEGGSASGQITYNFDNATVGETYGINANITAANFTAFTTYYIYGYDVNNNLISGFPISFSTQNYSTSKFWSFNVPGRYNATLKYCSTFDITCSNVLGILHDLDIASVYIPPVSYAYSITTDKLSYVPGETIIFSIDNPSSSKIYMDVFDPDITGFGVPELGINIEIPAGASGYTISKTIPQNINKGNYTSYLISGLLTEASFNILDSSAFNISAPSSTSNSIFIGWDRNDYNLGDNGILTTVSDYNSTTVYVVSPTGVNKTYLFPSNSTNSTIISLNVIGSWKATLINATGYKLFANATVFAGSPIGNETFANCLFSETYICWDNTQYEQGDPYTISFKETIPFFAFPFKPYVQISNPSGTIIYNQSINGSYDPLEGIFIGTISGNFDPQASTGIYYARLINLNILGETEVKAEAAAIVVPGVSVTTTEGQVSTTTATNLLNVLGMIAFYGLVIYVGLLYGLIRLMTMNGAPLNGSGFIYVAVILANIIALIGLFDPFKMYVLVLTWIIAGATFTLGRRAVSGGD